MFSIKIDNDIVQEIKEVEIINKKRSFKREFKV